MLSFRTLVWNHFQHNQRSFAWRETRDPWHILVSEVMLQQTQTHRVAPKYDAWFTQFPDLASLAEAPLSAVYEAWKGLGYNNRAMRLRNSARICLELYGGQVPQDEAALLALPGIGRYTARAVRCFSWNHTDAFLETNIRSALIFHFFPDPQLLVKDQALEPVAAAVLDRSDPRTWHYAMMDYGAWLKKVTANPSRRSTAHAKQPAFEGSPRQARGAVLRALAEAGAGTVQELADKAGLAYPRAQAAVAALAAEGLVRYEGGMAGFSD
ncbi:MAG: helix-turn-helix domain-containing protein [Spirochaetia bacterium]|jgi:A/G-specific adenine glycosylase|nr:helix-turn-helix domain-containing protein [Spirochaetia bacterium]